MTILRLLQSVHGHLGVLAAAALLHPAILLRRGRPLSSRNRLALVGSTTLALAAWSSGLLVYEDYRGVVRRALFRASPTAGLLFETKEHLALAVVAVATGAAAAALAAPRTACSIRRAAAVAYASAAALCLAVAAIGTWVTSVRGFPP